MRPKILFPLFAPLTSLRGIGPRLGPLYKRLCGEHVADLLWHLPVGAIDRSYSPELKYADKDRVVTLTLDIIEHAPPPQNRPQLPYRIVGTDGTDQVIITHFNVKGDYLGKLYPTDRKVVVSGLLERFRGGWSMSHPDFVVPVERRDEIPRCEPVYALTEGISGKMLRKVAQQALEKAPDLPEWHDPALLAREKWPVWKEALRIAHNPQPESWSGPSPLEREVRRGGVTPGTEFQDSEKPVQASPPLPQPLSAYAKASADERTQTRRSFSEGGPRGEGSFPALPSSTAYRRLAYDELLADQLALAVIRRHHRASGGRALPGTGELTAKMKQALPFRLTPGQEAAAAEIGADMTAPKRMLRLLQGDVGSGKTIVALLAMLQAAESGAQAALMAPTEILAKQHYARLREFLKPIGVEIGLLVGKGRGGERQTVLDGLASGALKLVVGTHALFQEDVKFADLGLTVVDEQHRFGVNQRLQLSDKGRGVDILVMTATPIPRTLTLTAYGDMDVSRLLEKPAGRQPIDTRLVNLERLDEVIEGVGRQIARGAQVYWVCPLVAELETSDLAAATERAALLARKLNSSPLVGEVRRGGVTPGTEFQDSETSVQASPPLPQPLPRGEGSSLVGLVHGKMQTEAKDKVMASFASGAIKVLVATTVIEVGVDVPNASLMIIEHAERFGLAQLHQLRGRVGRGAQKSSCLLLYQHPPFEVAKARLTMLRETEDGFRIAEEDLRLRGPGEMLGTRQSGAPEFRIANLALHQDLLHMAHDDARLILHRDPELNSERGKALRVLLYLFARDAAVPLLRAG